MAGFWKLFTDAMHPIISTGSRRKAPKRKGSSPTAEKWAAAIARADALDAIAKSEHNSNLSERQQQEDTAAADAGMLV